MDIRTLAERQLRDYDAHVPGTCFSEPSLEMSIAQAYELQFEVARRRELRGEMLAGYKIGCISRTMQTQLGLDRPVFGHVWESELHASGTALNPAKFDGLAIEGEFAVRLADDVPSRAWLRRHIDVLQFGFVVIELHNYVFRAPPTRRAVELIGNNAIHAGLVLPVEETRLADPGDLSNAMLRVWKNGELMGESTGHEDQRGPLDAIAKLVDHLDQHNRMLLKGQLILTGSPLPLWPIITGDTIVAECQAFGKRSKLSVTSQSAGQVSERSPRT